MSRFPLAVCVISAMLATTITAVFGSDIQTGFLDRTLTLNGNKFRYQVFLPASWSRKSKWPVILFLHGAGERGEDGLLQTEVGIGRAIRRAVERFRCIVVLPQCSKNRWWTEPDMESVALEALEASIKEFNGDRSRIYLTGLSMGGYGTWSIARKHPGEFAALVVICGGIAPPPGLRLDPAITAGVADNAYAETARKIGSTPVWVFHGDADPSVPVDESRRMVEALKATGGKVKYTEYPGVGHNSWDAAYGDSELMTWLLAQTLPNADIERSKHER
ncbi:MAG TPA: prolyl oligopeptidase family serine peptidase [Blastocatellia bacterium]|nr:prolyl oligopeptidase family serine peptidase [Blastocatellia bacterium]